MEMYSVDMNTIPGCKCKIIDFWLKYWLKFTLSFYLSFWMKFSQYLIELSTIFNILLTICRYAQYDITEEDKIANSISYYKLSAAVKGGYFQFFFFDLEFITRIDQMSKYPIIVYTIFWECYNE